MRVGGIVLAFALAGCGPLAATDASRVCRIPSQADLAEALGAPPMAEAVAPSENGVRECAWSAADAARSLSITLHTSNGGTGGSAQAVFAQELQALETEFTATRIIGGLGEAAVMGFSDVSAAGFSGGLIARKGKTVLVMRIEGEDPAAFERIGRAVAGKI